MKRLFIHSIIFLTLLCACSKADKALNNIENSMIEKPERAFTALVELDTLSMSEHQKDRRALLQAYLAVVNDNATDITSADLNRATSAFDGECTSDEVKSLIIQSEIAKLSNNPVVRLELLKDAEFLATQLDDKPDLAFIYLYLSNAYSKGYNGAISERYANKSLRLFNELNYKKQSIDARMAIAGAFAVKRDYKTLLDSLMAMKPDVMSYATDSYKLFFLDQLARALDENDRSLEAIEIWHGLFEIDSISSNTLAHWARAYIHTNQLDSAEILINRAISLPHNITDEYLCRNVQYEIVDMLGRKSELPLIDSLRNKAANIDYGERKIAESSLAMNEKYESVTQSAWRELQSNKQRTIILTAVFIILLLLMVGAIVFYKKRNKMLIMENENNLLRIQNIEHNLFAKEREHNIVAEKVAALFKSRFDTIDQLTSTYFECKETAQEQKRIFAETKSIIDKFSSTSSMRELEEIVNTANDNLMARFDKDFPKLSATQRKLALLIFCGLSLQSISIFQGADLRNIYVYKSRLKSTILKSDSSEKELYLSFFG